MLLSLSWIYYSVGKYPTFFLQKSGGFRRSAINLCYCHCHGCTIMLESIRHFFLQKSGGFQRSAIILCYCHCHECTILLESIRHFFCKNLVDFNEAQYFIHFNWQNLRVRQKVFGLNNNTNLLLWVLILYSREFNFDLTIKSLYIKRFSFFHNNHYLRWNSH